MVHFVSVVKHQERHRTGHGQEGSETEGQRSPPLHFPGGDHPAENLRGSHPAGGQKKSQIGDAVIVVPWTVLVASFVLKDQIRNRQTGQRDQHQDQDRLTPEPLSPSPPTDQQPETREGAGCEPEAELEDPPAGRRQVVHAKSWLKVPRVIGSVTRLPDGPEHPLVVHGETGNGGCHGCGDGGQHSPPAFTHPFRSKPEPQRDRQGQRRPRADPERRAGGESRHDRPAATGPLGKTNYRDQEERDQKDCRRMVEVGGGVQHKEWTDQDDPDDRQLTIAAQDTTPRPTGQDQGRR